MSRLRDKARVKSDEATELVPHRAASLLQVCAPPSLANKLARVTWMFANILFVRWTPVPLHEWRVWVLRAFGARIGKACSVYPDVSIWAPWRLTMAGHACLGPRVICYNVANVRIGAGAVVSQGAHLCSATHDIRNPDFAMMSAPIDIGQGAWVAAEAFIHPGMEIGEDAVVGARAVVTRRVAAGTVVAGNPARLIGLRDQGSAS